MGPVPNEPGGKKIAFPKAGGGQDGAAGGGAGSVLQPFRALASSHYLQ